MNSICRRLWDRDLTLKKWAELNNYNYNTAQAVLRNVRGQWRAGVAKKIRNSLINQGFATVEDFNMEQ